MGGSSRERDTALPSSVPRILHCARRTILKSCVWSCEASRARIGEALEAEPTRRTGLPFPGHARDRLQHPDGDVVGHRGQRSTAMTDSRNGPRGPPRHFESKQNEARQTLLMQELAHRVKNTLAMVQAVATQTLRNAVSLEAAGEALGARLIALAQAHDVLMQGSVVEHRPEEARRRSREASRRRGAGPLPRAGTRHQPGARPGLTSADAPRTGDERGQISAPSRRRTGMSRLPGTSPAPARPSACISDGRSRAALGSGSDADRVRPTPDRAEPVSQLRRRTSACPTRATGVVLTLKRRCGGPRRGRLNACRDGFRLSTVCLSQRPRHPAGGPACTLVLDGARRGE